MKPAGIPFLPYLNGDAPFAQRMNFAVAGSTALSPEALGMRFHHQDCSEKLKKSLFMVGEIGGNDHITMPCL
ncbi:hypothetical protein SLEP1_g10808 [Rubroshorea leprosula]|uniref:Uncharacterized protein n=1 Tax=Rubroshorea leprosula TaxID=152421 RepID=A0AAV5IF32_9ROSI|nr:hypothetical protein SLEP1_g10808 [Rubroshorea leprosula]